MSDGTLARRRFLVLAGATTVTGLAGCTGTAPTNGTGSGGTTTDPAADNGDGGGHMDDGDHMDGDHMDGDHMDEVPASPAATADVEMTSTSEGEHFEPHVVWVEKGGTVTWTLESGTHSTTAYTAENDRPQLVPDGTESWDSGILTETGATFERTFETEGVYHYYCIPHETLGMLGSVIVGRPDPHDQPALGEPPAELPDRVREKLHELDDMCDEALEHAE